MKMIKRVLSSIYFDYLLAAIAVVGFTGPFFITKNRENDVFLILTLFVMWLLLIIILFLKSKIKNRDRNV
ncbi:hypothetical protein [Halobacteriovorax sp. HLS]|uniref:hypothetical protein n=1 Tax=Halobacteriovorax sp. HLS TaxID=2234000 RepID=UPI000FD8CBA7|nr:hypothetical protein [Halobacteriovorax sp. HLS]